MAAEKSFENQLKSWLESEGVYALGTEKQKMLAEPCGYWEKRWGGGKYTKAGLPDMHIVVNGVSIEAELKSETGKLSELQIQKLNQIADANCIGMVLYPHDFDKFKKLVRYIKVSGNPYTDIVVLSGLKNGGGT